MQELHMKHRMKAPMKPAIMVQNDGMTFAQCSLIHAANSHETILCNWLKDARFTEKYVSRQMIEESGSHYICLGDLRPATVICQRPGRNLKGNGDTITNLIPA